jgi:UDP-2,3-diacylglucosamine pyrophosphatase LpxH
MRRKLEVCVLSDLHLGSFGCKAKEIAAYLNSIDTKVLVLNGDIIDIWRFKKEYFPVDHSKVIQLIMEKINQGTKVYYLTGNHDEALRKFSDFHLNNFFLLDKLTFNLDGKKYWILHGDVLDLFNDGWTKWLAQFGSWGYDFIIWLNHIVDLVRVKFGMRRRSFSKKVKDSVKYAVKWIGDFEQKAIDIAIKENYDFVICGHIHCPSIRQFENEQGKTVYMNSGDWIENLTALEYTNKSWKLFKYEESKVIPYAKPLKNKELFKSFSLNLNSVLSFNSLF